jgi:arylsulfatase A-like enzyme
MKVFIVCISFCLFVSTFAAERPNVVVILTDDQGWGDLSMSGNKDLSTPNIDSIAKEGATFNNFYVSPVCSPTRAEFLTGRYSFRSGVYSTSAGGERIDLDEVTIADTFKAAGYKTGAYGKWHSGMQYPYHPNGRGFEDYYGFCSGHWGNYFDPMLEHNGNITKGKGFCVDDFTERAMDFMETNKDVPFFVYLPYNTPHSPMQVPDKYWDKFKNKKLQMDHNLKQTKKGKSEDFVKAALAMCENIDWNVGRVLKKLDELKITDNTIVLYFSDNGPNNDRWNLGMKGRKGSRDEGGVRSPLVMKWPAKIKAGIKVNEVTGAVDLLPSLTSMSGIPMTSKLALDGKNFEGLVTDKNSDWNNERTLFTFWKGRSSLRYQNYRLDERGKLFDIENDRQQKTDISQKYPEVTSKLTQAKKDLVMQASKELPKVDPRPFVICHPDFKYTQIPARDGKAHGNIKRSNRFPNCSFFTNWTTVEDKITFDVEVLSAGEYEVEIYYTCEPGSIGSIFELSCGKSKLQGKISKAHNPPLTGMELDRSKRIESYVKDFKTLTVGKIRLDKGKGILTLRALEIPGKQVMDFRLMMLKKLSLAAK